MISKISLWSRILSYVPFGMSERTRICGFPSSYCNPERYQILVVAYDAANNINVNRCGILAVIALTIHRTLQDKLSCSVSSEDSSLVASVSDFSPVSAVSSGDCETFASSTTPTRLLITTMSSKLFVIEESASERA